MSFLLLRSLNFLYSDGSALVNFSANTDYLASKAFFVFHIFTYGIESLIWRRKSDNTTGH